jgi:tripartite-type tricarboxylate transporter receptor subunit TctC
MRLRAIIGSFLALAGVLAIISFANAQEPIRLIFPFAAGGSGDAIARILAENLRTTLDRAVIVDSRTGGAGRVGVTAVKHAPPDGSTLLFTPIAPLAVYQHVYKALDYDPFADFLPVAQVGTFDFGVAVGFGGAKSLQEFVAWAKANPAQANYGIPAIGTLPHFLGAMFGRAASIDLRQVPYRGSAPALADLIGGQLPILVTTTSDLAEAHKAERIRVLATSGSARSPFLPDVPTFREAGYDLEASGWYGIFAPAKTPPDVVARLSKAIVTAVRAPDVRERLLAAGLEPTGVDAEEFGRIQKTNAEFWGQAVKASGFVATD